CQHGYGTPYSF
nr:immunoglobulin light chain junction region [Macaca mulatta]MOV34231.1 immunoglobulin light chain junction region [Macaca mulatta]MOV34250.1 immunoglobulin light chain junction region [Macaca mulatta]MOV34368.1 immunoglobulin light chain junction region [Macaca mulatta]MOV34410.1 immunoglobulin light chain junction region [Macaca mulatta]